MKFFVLFFSFLMVWHTQAAISQCQIASTIFLTEEIKKSSDVYQLLENNKLLPEYFGSNKDSLFEILIDNAHIPFEIACIQSEGLPSEVTELLELIREAQLAGACVRVSCP